MKHIKIGERWVGKGKPTYVIAEIGSNFDGDLKQAKHLVSLAKEVGADAAKFQSFLPEKIIAPKGFQQKTSFQAGWKSSVYDVYKRAAFPRQWHQEVAEHARSIGIHFFSSPYDREAVDLLCEVGVPALKIGSGDITFLSLVEYIASKGKPVILGTGASTMKEIEEAVKVIRCAGNQDIILLQCVTAYPTPIDKANIRAMTALEETFNVMVGYSDHAPGNVVALGAVALGAAVIEKHFTFDKTREGPDHPFAMDTDDMTDMIRKIRLMEQALGSPVKEVTDAEKETVIIQRRSLFARVDIPHGTGITADMVEALRPATGIAPKHIGEIIGSKASVDITQGEPITWDKI